MLSITTFAQTTATGKVVDEKGAAISGATVLEKGTKNGTTTATDGSYSLKVKAGAKLVISSVGYEALSLGITTSLQKSTLKSSSESISEVVVTALGINKSREKVGYSATTFKSEDVVRSAPVSPLDALQARIAGADISTVGGQPGASSKVVLRGYGSITGGNQALIVVDGVPFNNGRLGSVNEALDFGNGLNDLNPNDIENISVLKGSAATSLYGSAGAAGVVMITTKKGKSGKLKVDVSNSTIFSSVGKLPTFQNTFGQGWNGQHYKEENGSWGPRLDGKTRLWGSVVDNSRLLKAFSPVENNLRDFFETGYELNNNVSIKGGNDNTNFYFSYGNVKSDGILPGKNDVFNRHTVSLRGETRYNDFTISSSFNYITKIARVATTDDNAEGSSTFENIIQIPRDFNITDLRDYNNKFFNVDNYYTPYAANPYFSLNENGNNYSNDRFFGNLDLGYKLSKTFNVKWRVGYDVASSKLKDYQAVERPKANSWRGPNATNFEGASYTAKTGAVLDRSDYERIINSDFFVNYTHNITKDITLDGFGGFNYQENESRFQTAFVTNLTIPNFYNITNSTNNPTANQGIFLSRKIGLFAQANFGYRDMIFVTVNGRNDWTSTLAPGSNSYFYPGVSASVLVHKLANIKSKDINFLKFRAAYGGTGNDTRPYRLKSTLVGAQVALGYGSMDFPLNGVSAFEIGNQIASANLVNERINEGELGMEAKFFNNRVGIDVAVYEKISDKQILPIPISASTGYTTLVANAGKIKNSGIELELSLNPILKKDFRWDVKYTYTKNFNRVLSLPDGFDKIDLRTAHYDVKMTARVGKSIGLIEAIKPQMTSNGQIIVNEANGMPIPTLDDYIYGNINKDFIMGLNNSFTYKNLRLGFTFDYRMGGMFVSRTADLTYFVGNAYATTYNDRKPFIVPNSVNSAGVDINGKPVYVENTTPIDMANINSYYYHTTNKAQAWEKRILPKSFLKLRDITLSYTFPSKIAKKISADNIVFTLIGRNLLIWTPKENAFVDPEATNLNNDLTGEFGEFATSPTTKSFGFSFKIGF
jgi:TonB-linked SusC/RagA family outer membrane protein